MRRNCHPPHSAFPVVSKVCCSTVLTRRCWSARKVHALSCGSRCRKQDASPTSRSVKRAPSVSRRSVPSVSAPAAMTAETAVGVAAPRARLALLLLFAPALVWLVGLIVLPHLELAVL